MKRHLILVSPNYWANEKAHWAKELERIRKEMRATGMSVFKNLLQKPQLDAYRNYSRRLWETLGGWKINEEMKMQKCQWNDEPFGRYLNHALTNFAALIAEEPLMHPGLVLPIFIMKGVAFSLSLSLFLFLFVLFSYFFIIIILRFGLPVAYGLCASFRFDAGYGGRPPWTFRSAGHFPASRR